MDNSSSPMNRDRSRRGERQSRFSDANNSGSVGGGNDRDRDRSREHRGPTNRIYVSNIPYEFRWQDLKDLCRDMVGEVSFVELFNDENGKPRGCGIVEFKQNDSVATALDKMNRHEINGRHLVIKEDHGDERDECGRVIRSGGSANRGGGGGGRGGGGVMNSGGGGGGFNPDRDDDRPRPGGGGGGHGGNSMLGLGGGNNGSGGDFDNPYNTFGLSTSFLEGLGIQGPLYNKIFVANLDYKVDAKKLKQVFKLAGRVISVDLSADKDGNSRGFAVVEYDHPVEAVQAISMFDHQVLFDRRMTVRLDRIPDKGEGVKMPDGLKGIGIGLGPNGEPLKNVAYNLRNMNNQNAPAPSVSMNGGGVGGVQSSGVPANPSGALSSAAAAASLLGPAPNNPLRDLAALNSVMSNLTGTLSNPLSNSLAGLSSLGLGALANSGVSGGGVSGVGGGGQDQQSNQQGGGGGYGGANQGFQSAYSTPVFNTNLAQLRNRNDYDQGNNAVRNYSTQSVDYGHRGSQGANNSFGNSAPVNSRKSDTIIIKNLPGTCNWQTLRDKFRDMGEVKHAEMRGHDTGIVRFADEKDAELAIKIMDGGRFDNQTVFVSYF